MTTATNNATTNAAFLRSIDRKTRDSILMNIALGYGISADAAMREVTHPEAESLLDYLTEPVRSAASVLMRRHAIA
jgi:hypothetical protein